MTNAELARRLQQYLTETAGELGVPGACAGIGFGDLLAVATHGVTSIADPLAVTPETLFMIGSTSKLFTATLAMSLVQRGRINLDRPVHTYLPEVLDCPARYREMRAEVLVADLFTHTAGWVGDTAFDTGPGDDALAKAVVAQMAEVPQHTAPRARPSYNNLSLVVAARLIEVVGGDSYENLLRTTVLTPLGLRDTYLAPADVANRRHAIGHLDTGDGLKPVPQWPLPRCFTPTGGIVSTAADQIAFARFHLTGERPAGAAGEVPIDDDMRVLMREARTTMNPTMDVGINWLLRRRFGLHLATHGGNVSYQQLSAFATVPSAGLAVTTLTNARAGEKLGARVLDWALTELAGAHATGLPEGRAPGDPSELVGDYGTGDAYVAVRRADDGTLTAQNRYIDAPHFDSPVARLRFVEPDVVTSEDDSAEVAGVFLRDGSGTVDALRWGLRVGNRLPQVSAAHDSPTTRAGSAA